MTKDTSFKNGAIQPDQSKSVLILPNANTRTTAKMTPASIASRARSKKGNAVAPSSLEDELMSDGLAGQTTEPLQNYDDGR